MTAGQTSTLTVASLTITVLALITVTVALVHAPSTGLPSWTPATVGAQASVTAGAGTRAVAPSPDGRTVYAGLFPTHGSGGVAVVDVASRAVRRVVPLPSGVLGLAVDRAGTRVYATASDVDALEVIDPDAGTVVRTIPVGSYPQGVALAPDGRTAYVVDYGDDDVSVVDLSAGQVTAQVSVGTGPGELAVSPDGSQVVVGNQNDDTVSVIDTASPTSSDAIPVGQGASHVAFSPDGSRLFVSLSNHGFGPFEILELDPASHETRTETELDHLVFSLAASGDHVYAGTVTPRGGPSFLDTLAADGSAVTGELPLPGEPESIALSPDGRLLWATTNSSDLTACRVA